MLDFFGRNYVGLMIFRVVKDEIWPVNIEKVGMKAKFNY